jgi:glyoxylase-like metal-dependent hydrolase (beta-lactamase superfamily II)
MKFKVLIEGYAREVDGEEYASSSTTLIIDNNIKIIVDPGTNREMLLESLANENLTPSDIDYVILTHTHLDHCLLTGIFENAKVLDNESIYSWDSKITEQNDVLGENIKMIPTPGHDPFHVSILLKNTEKGNVVIAGDVFWWWDDEKLTFEEEDLINKEDPYTKNKEQLLNSRKELLEIADYIIPGHGKPYNAKMYKALFKFKNKCRKLKLQNESN